MKNLRFHFLIQYFQCNNFCDEIKNFELSQVFKFFPTFFYFQKKKLNRRISNEIRKNSIPEDETRIGQKQAGNERDRLLAYRMPTQTRMVAPQGVGGGSEGCYN